MCGTGHTTMVDVVTLWLAVGETVLQGWVPTLLSDQPLLETLVASQHWWLCDYSSGLVSVP